MAAAALHAGQLQQRNPAQRTSHYHRHFPGVVVACSTAANQHQRRARLGISRTQNAEHRTQNAERRTQGCAVAGGRRRSAIPPRERCITLFIQQEYAVGEPWYFLLTVDWPCTRVCWNAKPRRVCQPRSHHSFCVRVCGNPRKHRIERCWCNPRE